MRILITCLGLLLVGLAPVSARTYAQMSDDDIRAQAGRELSAAAARLAPQCTERSATLDAVVSFVQVRQGIMDSLRTVRNLTQVDGILLADAVDDSLVRHLGSLLEVYRDAVPDPIMNPGTEKFRQGMNELGFVRNWATGFLVHLEMQQIALLLADFRLNRSAAEVEAAEDAYLRHVDLLCQLYRAQHIELEDLHNCSMTNLEWVIGRLESENGTSDFVATEQWLADRPDGFAYSFKLVSPTTGESMEIFYPLPYMTLMDEGWQQRLKEREQKGESVDGGQ